MLKLHDLFISWYQERNVNKKKALLEWNDECQEAFNKLKQLCSQTPILAYANYKKPFKLHTDASENGLGAVLYQKQDDGTDHVTAYASHTLLKSEKNYDAHKLEILALKWSGIERFHGVSIWWRICSVYRQQSINLHFNHC